MPIVDKNKCVACRTCKSDCPTHAIDFEDELPVFGNSCFRCGHCLAICPEGAISIPEIDDVPCEMNSSISSSVNPESFLQMMKFRRSIRQFSSRKIDSETLARLAEVARYSAHGCNRYNYRLAFIQDKLDEFQDKMWDGIEKYLKTDISKARDSSALFKSTLESFRKDNNDRMLMGAPCALIVGCTQMCDASLLAQCIEIEALSHGIGCCYCGYLKGALEIQPELQDWIGLEGFPVQIAMLLGYPSVKYYRSAPRPPANVNYI